MLYFNEGTEVVMAKPIIKITDDSKHSETENKNVAASVSQRNKRPYRRVHQRRPTHRTLPSSTAVSFGDSASGAQLMQVMMPVSDLFQRLLWLIFVSASNANAKNTAKKSASAPRKAHLLLPLRLYSSSTVLPS